MLIYAMMKIIILLIPKRITNIFLAIFLTKLCILIKFIKSVLLYRGKNAFNKFIGAVLKENEYCKKVMKNFLIKILSAVVKRSFKSSNKCWIWNKLFATGNNTVRDHDHVTGKYRSSAHWNCNINLKLAKKDPVIFHNLKGSDRHLIMREISKLMQK